MADSDEQKAYNSYSKIYDFLEIYEKIRAKGSSFLLEKLSKLLVLFTFNLTESYVRDLHNPSNTKKLSLSSLDEILKSKETKPMYYNIRNNVIRMLKESEIVK